MKQKFGDLDDHGRNAEEEFDKLKDVMEEGEDSQEEKTGEEEGVTETPAKKKSATPKVSHMITSIILMLLQTDLRFLQWRRKVWAKRS